MSCHDESSIFRSMNYTTMKHLCVGSEALAKTISGLSLRRRNRIFNASAYTCLILKVTYIYLSFYQKCGTFDKHSPIPRKVIHDFPLVRKRWCTFLCGTAPLSQVLSRPSEIDTCLHMTFGLHACSARLQAMSGYPPAGVKVSGKRSQQTCKYVYPFIRTHLRSQRKCNICTHLFVPIYRPVIRRVSTHIHTYYVCVYIYIYMYMYACAYMYIYIYYV